jgi:hypothetical protein
LVVNHLQLFFILLYAKVEAEKGDIDIKAQEWSEELKKHGYADAYLRVSVPSVCYFFFSERSSSCSASVLIVLVGGGCSGCTSSLSCWRQSPRRRSRS